MLDIPVSMQEVIEMTEEAEYPSMTKWCYLIIGAEGCGNYMLRNALVSAGCYHEAKLDTFFDDPYDYDFGNMPDKLAFHRSIPHAGKYEDLAQLAACLGDGGYKVHVLITFREQNAVANSVSRRKGLDYYDVYYDYVHALRYIPRILGWVEQLTIVTYEAFVTSEGFRRWLFEERLGLSYPEDFEVYNANEAYYD